MCLLLVFCFPEPFIALYCAAAIVLGALLAGGRLRRRNILTPERQAPSTHTQTHTHRSTDRQKQRDQGWGMATSVALHHAISGRQESDGEPLHANGTPPLLTLSLRLPHPTLLQHPTRSPLKFTLIPACIPIPTSRAPPRQSLSPVKATDGGKAIGRISRAWAAAKYSRHTACHVPVSAS